MIVSAAIVAKNGTLFCSDNLPSELKGDISKHANNFLYAISIEDDDIELPYIETTSFRYIYKQTDDLYWLLVTKPESEMFTDIDILGKFVCTIMEYGASETNSSTLTDEQRDLFYKHVWRPWDDGVRCSFCNCRCNSPERWEQEFDSRLQFFISIRNGHVDENDVSYFTGLMNESWALSAKLTPRWDSKSKVDRRLDDLASESDSLCSAESQDHSIGEEVVIDGCRIKCRLEDIRIELARIQDPYLRLFAKRDLLKDSLYNPDSNHLSSAPTVDDLDTTDVAKFEVEFLQHEDEEQKYMIE